MPILPDIDWRDELYDANPRDFRKPVKSQPSRHIRCGYGLNTRSYKVNQRSPTLSCIFVGQCDDWMPPKLDASEKHVASSAPRAIKFRSPSEYPSNKISYAFLYAHKPRGKSRISRMKMAEVSYCLLAIGNNSCCTLTPRRHAPLLHGISTCLLAMTWIYIILCRLVRSSTAEY